MNNYNPLFNTMNMTRMASPFQVVGSSATNALSQATRNSLFSKIGGSKMTLSGILNGAQKTIGTVNQVIPLYNQVKPLFQNSKILLNVAKGIKGNNKDGLFNSRRKSNFTKQPITQDESTNKQEENIIDVKEATTKKTNNQPSQPFFL